MFFPPCHLLNGMTFFPPNFLFSPYSFSIVSFVKIITRLSYCLFTSLSGWLLYVLLYLLILSRHCCFLSNFWEFILITIYCENSSCSGLWRYPYWVISDLVLLGPALWVSWFYQNVLFWGFRVCHLDGSTNLYHSLSLQKLWAPTSPSDSFSTCGATS